MQIRQNHKANPLLVFVTCIIIAGTITPFSHNAKADTNKAESTQTKQNLNTNTKTVPVAEANTNYSTTQYPNRTKRAPFLRWEGAIPKEAPPEQPELKFNLEQAQEAAKELAQTQSETEGVAGYMDHAQTISAINKAWLNEAFGGKYPTSTTK